MASPKLTAEQAAKQKKALKAFHANKEKPTSAKAPNRPQVPRALKEMNTAVTAMVPKALEVLKKTLEGDLQVSKTQSDMAKYITNLAASNAKAELDFKLQSVKYAVDLAKAQAAGAVPVVDQQEVAKEAASKGQHIRPILEDFPYDESWDEEVQEDLDE